MLDNFFNDAGGSESGRRIFATERIDGSLGVDSGGIAQLVFGYEGILAEFSGRKFG